MDTALYTDTLVLHSAAGMRSHSDLVRTVNTALAELVDGGVLVRKGDDWRAGSVIVAQEFTYEDSMKRSQKAVLFGTWLCLALVLKFTNEDVRQKLMGYLRRHAYWAHPTFPPPPKGATP